MIVPSTIIRKHYEAARRKVLGRGSRARVFVEHDNLEKLSTRQAQLRRISVEFHRRLKRAGIAVEGAES